MHMRVAGVTVMKSCAKPQAVRSERMNLPLSPPTKPVTSASSPSVCSTRATLIDLPDAYSATCFARFTESICTRSKTSERCRTGVVPMHRITRRKLPAADAIGYGAQQPGDADDIDGREEDP